MYSIFVKVVTHLKNVYFFQQIGYDDIAYAEIWACMIFFLNIRACMVSKSENTKRKFEMESKEEDDIQQICYDRI